MEGAATNPQALKVDFPSESSGNESKQRFRWVFLSRRGPREFLDGSGPGGPTPKAQGEGLTWGVPPPDLVPGSGGGITGSRFGIDQESLNNYQKSTKAQQLAFEAMFESLWSESWFSGCYIWQWDTRTTKERALESFDFSPRFKPAENTISKWYGNHQN